MRKTWTLWLILSSLTGCAVLPSDPTYPEANAASPASAIPPGTLESPSSLPPRDSRDSVAQIDANLARLRGLHVVDVGELILRAPAGAANCYSLACPGDEDRARVEAAARLARLADAADTAATCTPADACAPEVIDHNLVALMSLQLVEVRGLLRAEPVNNPNCYNLPCESDIEAARQLTCERAGRLANIADAARGL